MKPHIFTLLLLCALPVLAQQENADIEPDRAARRAARAAYWGRFFSVGYEGGTIAPFGIRGVLGLPNWNNMSEKISQPIKPSL